MFGFGFFKKLISRPPPPAVGDPAVSAAGEKMHIAPTPPQGDRDAAHSMPALEVFPIQNAIDLRERQEVMLAKRRAERKENPPKRQQMSALSANEREMRRIASRRDRQQLTEQRKNRIGLKAARKIREPYE